MRWCKVPYHSIRQSDSPQAVTNSNYILYSNLQAAKRGIEVEVTLPVSAGLQAGQTSCLLW